MQPRAAHRPRRPALTEQARQESNLQPPVRFIPLPDASVAVVLSNGVVNLSFRKRRVVHELFRVLKTGGRCAIADIVSAKHLSQSIVSDPKLWAS